MEKRSELRLLWAAAAFVALGCTRAPLSRGASRAAPPVAAPDSFVVNTHPARVLPTQVATHVAREEREGGQEREGDEEREQPQELDEPAPEESQAEEGDAYETEGDESEPSYDAVFSEVEVERYEEKESGVSFGPMALYSVLVLQRVASYDAWRAAFDAQLPARRSAGFASQAVMRGAYDPKLVAVWLAATDVALARDYLAQLQTRDAPAKSAKLAKPAARSGKPRAQLARNLMSKLDSTSPGLHAALVTLRVEDLPAFRGAFEADSKRRAGLGIVGYALTQDVDDEALIYVYLQSTDPSRLKAYLTSRTTKQSWHDAGVTATKSTTIVREGELSLCQ